MIKSVCGYCGVGCGIEFDTSKLIGDISYPTNEGLLCAKGASELHTIETSSRLLRPQIKQDGKFNTIDWDTSIKYISSKIKKSEPERVVFYLSGQLLTEDYYIANKLAKGFINTNNVDTNSRTCMASAVVAHKKAFGVDYVPVRMRDIKKANLLILVGSNAAEAHVVFFNKIKKELKRGLKLVVIDPRVTPTTKAAHLHLQINVGSDIDFFNLVCQRLITDEKIDSNYIEKYTNNFETYKNKLSREAKTKMLKRTGLSKEQFEEFITMFYENENIISAWTMGLNQSVQGVDKNLSLINMHLITGKINKEGNGPFSLTGQPNAMGGREVGGLATTLAVHLDFEAESIKKVEEFWKTSGIKNKRGLTSCEIVDEALKGNVEVLIISHTDPIYHLPNRAKVEKAFRNIPLIVEINAYENSETSEFSHIRLPASPWGEKDGTQTNMDRTITKQKKVTRTSIDCKPDWEVFKLIAWELGFKKSFDYSTVEDIFNEFKEMTKISKKRHLDMHNMKGETFIWGEKLFKDNKFLTQNEKANLHFVKNENLSEKTSKEFPFILLTGRTRDQWHSGTKTALLDNLKKFKALEYVEIHPNDAKNLEIEDGDMVDVTSVRGEITLEAKITPDVKEKTVFIPVSVRKINYLTLDLVDKESFEPDYNHSAVRVKSITRL
ncbi:molybdopterin oxidoreductase [Arcobacter nitrofigilis DSM 7299]|uniref:Molybdopterin oxidoreductase n=1 Tax=Arcobacter nitrofigilis (strain ATCC 33309 / DSM 7299 / CCUG 15893 / LMG 7604 / NCTC 12251 / CI) TaxID=572480 RepID=D5V5N2_ARCNC|nr:molybdopterin oxidoreductase family protein [Arcobacter nitrofigilis]ADG92068.1 molybdopterin oxidoreductase [Arcobacter nitrofigilis DSM 7299]